MVQLQFACTCIIYDDRNLQFQESQYIPLIILTFITTGVYIQWRTLWWNDHSFDKQSKANSMHKTRNQKREYVPEYV